MLLKHTGESNRTRAGADALWLEALLTLKLDGAQVIPLLDYGVLDGRLREHEYLADSYSIADIATWPWISRFEWQEIDLAIYPNVKRWYLAIADRPAVQRGYDVPARMNPIPRPR